MNTSCAPHTGQDSQDPQETKVTTLLHNPLKQLEDLSAEASKVYDKEVEHPACLEARERQSLTPEPGRPRVRWERTRRL